MPSDGSRLEEAPSRISREILPRWVREARASYDRAAREPSDLVEARHLERAIPRERGHPAGSASVRCHNKHSPTTVAVTTAKLAGVSIR